MITFKLFLESFPPDRRIATKISDDIRKGTTEKIAFAKGWTEYNKKPKPINTNIIKKVDTVQPVENNAYYRAKNGLEEK